MADLAYLVRDLLFTSKIREVAGQLGLSVKGAPDPAGLQRAAEGARFVIVDLRLDRALEALDVVRADPRLAGATTIGFVEHERADVMDAARAHGCAHVLAKGAFARALPDLLGAGTAAG